MRRTAVLICPGRGTYNAGELGYLARHHGAQAQVLAGFDAQRAALGQPTLTELDGAAAFSPQVHTRGDNASALIYAASLLDGRSVDPAGFDIVAVTGNSMGWYTALAAAGALSAEDGLRVVNTMGTLMQRSLIGGQMVYPVVGADWRPDPDAEAALVDLVAGIDARADHVLSLSIRLGGMLVVAGNRAGLAAFEAAVPKRDGGFPMQLRNHAAFHTALQAPVAAQGRDALPASLFGQPGLPLVDGRGAIWWPKATDATRLWDYTLGHQVVETFDFSRALAVCAREFAPDVFIVAGPGETLGGATAQALIGAGWKGLGSKADFQAIQAVDPVVLSMGRADQRAAVTGP